MHNPLDMLVFAKVVELRGFSTAARRLGMSRSTASKHVSRLAEEVDATAQGLGIGLLPTFAIAGEIAAGRLIRLLPDWVPLGTFGNSRTGHFIADRHLTPKIRALIDFLAARFGRMPPWDVQLLSGETTRKRA